MSYRSFDDEFFKRIWRMFKDFDKKFRELEREFKIDFREFEHESGVKGFRVEIKDIGEGKPEVKVAPIGKPSKIPIRIPLKRPKKEAEPKKVKPITRMLETNCGKIERPNEVVLTMQTPGIEKRDVEIRRIGDTLEVIARKPGGEAYFGAFELPPNAIPEEREIELKGETLIISIPRRMRYRG